MSYYPTQEDELRTKEAEAEGIKKAEEAKFLSTFQAIPARNVGRLSELAKAIVSNFNRIMEEARQEPYQRQEDIMAGQKKKIKEEDKGFAGGAAYKKKKKPPTALREK